MGIRLVDSGWAEELSAAIEVEHKTVRVVCPFITTCAAERLLEHGHPEQFQVITRFSIADFCAGVSDASALRMLVKAGARVRGIKHLHAKLYLFGERRVIVTSANLTEAGLLRNHEFGFVSEDEDVVGDCRQYFKALWKSAGADVSEECLSGWQKEVEVYLASGAGVLGTLPMPDHGADGGVSSKHPVSEGWASEATQAFVKFFGEGHRRVNPSESVLAEVRRSGCHWACTYPKKGGHPRAPRDGALMFLGRFVAGPNDTRIFGRAIGFEHQDARDVATEYDIEERPFKEKWSYYIRVHHPEFVAGNMANGVSLNEMMDELGSESFASTQRNAAKETGNLDPRRSYQRHPAVELTREGQAWLNERLERAFEEHGQMGLATLRGLDWPVAEAATA
ncbi:MAG: phospholipase D family protein [Solirubrobacteraceae bacterium]